MPAAKPTDLVAWATGGGALITTPSGSDILAGWADADEPPADWWNYVWNNDYKWRAYLNDFEAIAHTWSALQTFSAGIAVDTLTTTGDVAVGDDLTVVDHCTVDGPFAANGTAALNQGGTVATAKVLAFAGTAKATFTTNPATATGTSNELNAKGLNKAWGTISSGSSLVVRNGMNFASAARVAIGGDFGLRFTFTTAMADAYYHPSASAEGLAAIIQPTRTTSHFDVILLNASGTPQDPNGFTGLVSFSALGQQ